MRQRTPFRKILIANRGEIALRIMRTARRLGYGVVAVYSDADRDALHVREADQAVRIGEALPAQSYLKIEAIIAAAKASGADAVHPGYGFLAENADFAQRLPRRRPGVHRAVAGSDPGDGQQGRRQDASCRRPACPACPAIRAPTRATPRCWREADEHRLSRDDQGRRRRRRARHAAGRPMRRRFPIRCAARDREAQSAFGDPTVHSGARHCRSAPHRNPGVRRRYGHAIHLGERDCSVQRRHQKLIEEAPSPAVSPELRARMGAVAVARGQVDRL